MHKGSVAVLYVLLSITQQCAVCCMAYTHDNNGITVMDTKGHLYSLEVETQDIDIDQVDFTDDFREGSEINVSVQSVHNVMVGWRLLVLAVSL